MYRDRGNGRVNFIDLVLIVVVVLTVRILIERLLPLFYESFGLDFGDFVFQILSNYPLTIAIVIADFLVVFLLARNFPFGSGRVALRSLTEIGAMLGISFLSSVIVRSTHLSGFIGTSDDPFFGKMFFFAFAGNLVFNAIVILVMDLIFYYRWANRRAVAAEAEQRARANYQYQLLKSGTNPHFLFNSLNVLEYLIHEDQDRASDYVRKLADVYRYFLKLEDSTLVTLEEEISFVDKYCELLSERFGAGLQLEMDIPDSCMDTKIIPCALQMMVENAVKHNVVSTSRILRITMTVEGSNIVVRNNINPKNNDGKKGIGLKNINGQYEMLCSKKVSVENDGITFTVRIPLLP